MMKKLLCILLLLAGSAGADTRTIIQNTGPNGADDGMGPIGDVTLLGDSYWDDNCGRYGYLRHWLKGGQSINANLIRVDSLEHYLGADQTISRPCTLAMRLSNGVSGVCPAVMRRLLHSFYEGNKNVTAASTGEATSYAWYYDDSTWCWYANGNSYGPFAFGDESDTVNVFDGDSGSYVSPYVDCGEVFDSIMVTGMAAQSYVYLEIPAAYVQDRYDIDSALLLMTYSGDPQATPPWFITYSSNQSSVILRPYIIVWHEDAGPAPEPTGNVKGVTLRGVTLDSP